MSFQEKIRNEIKEMFQKEEKVLAAFEGGSAATGYLDEYSDLDLGIVTDDDYVEEIFKQMEEYLEQNYGVKHKFRMPEPNWHGHSQCFYILKESPATFYVDFLVEKESNPNRFTESDRHGNTIIWFDKKELIDTTATPDEVTLKKCQRQFNFISTYLPFMYIDLEKQLLRGLYIDACAIYMGLLNRFVALLNIKYRPAKHDFGMRYLHRDFPEAAVKLVTQLMNNSSLEQIRENLEIIKQEASVLGEELRKRFY
jgi:predicted nucleotidyltransferase